MGVVEGLKPEGLYPDAVGVLPEEEGLTVVSGSYAASPSGQMLLYIGVRSPTGA